MALHQQLKNGLYSSVISSFTKRSWGDDDRFVFPLEQVLKDQSKRAFDAKNTFSSRDEYFATIGLGAKIVQTISERKQGVEFASTLWILKQDDNGLIAIVKVPKKTREDMAESQTQPISPGDRGFVLLKYTAKGDAAAGSEPIKVQVRFSMEFIEPLPSSPRGFLATKLLLRQKRPRRSPFDFSLGKDEDKPDLETLPHMYDKPHELTGDLDDRKSMAFVLKTLPCATVPHHLSAQACMSHVLEQTGIPGYVDTVIRHGEFCYVFDAEQSLRTGGAHNSTGAFLSAPTNRVPNVDIYSRLGDKSLVESDFLQLNPSQREALSLTRSAPAGFVIAHGGPGTGKTHFIIQVAKPFFLDNSHHRLLLTSAGNRGADNIAEELDKWLGSLDASVRRDSYVKALSEKARKAAEESGNKSDFKLQNETITNHYRTYGCGKLNALGDDRVQSTRLAVGTMMKQKLSSRPDLQRRYDAYARGETTERSAVKEFHRLVNLFMQDVISGAGAVCATISGVGDETVRRGYAACDLIVVDEAARVPEYQWWTLLAFYQSDKKPIGKIMVGDHLQMEPAAGRDERQSTLARQMALSLQARLRDRGIPSRSFDIQYRAVPEIAHIYNTVVYDGRLQSDEQTHVEARPLAQALIKHNEAVYGKKSSVIFFDVAGAREQNEPPQYDMPSRNAKPNGAAMANYLKWSERPKGKPKFCNQFIFTVARIVEGLIIAGFCSGPNPATIAILTPYKVELKRLMHVKTKMKFIYPMIEQVSVETVDKVQGREYDIVIVDPVTTTIPSFLDFKRLNVMLSRARCAMYVLGCREQWDNMFDDTIDGSWSVAYPLSCFAKELYPFTKRYPTALDDVCPDSNEFYDPEEFKKVSERQKK
ncbi:hypothetical protein PG993_000090 [Apiospora rasikravindrae]|uniref:DNA2/NAM7 helicase-like C-terminal domain-containing protein n=1 Tax=Apiospora rasikravindrae TaxID=990691 RepID=A0ABR1U7L2_9PEZI